MNLLLDLFIHMLILLHTIVLIYYRVKYIPRLNGITITYVLRKKRKTILLAWCSRGTNFASQGVSWNCPSNYPAMPLQEVINGEGLYPILGDYLILINFYWRKHDFNLFNWEYRCKGMACICKCSRSQLIRDQFLFHQFFPAPFVVSHAIASMQHIADRPCVH